MDHIDSQLVRLCMDQGKRITGLTNNGEPVNGGRLLLTIAGLESSFGLQRLFVRMEPSYAPGGNYYQRDDVTRKLWQTYGCLAASSFGTFQIMYATARELGFTGHPIDLQKDEVCAYWATTLICLRIIKYQGAVSLVDVLDAYNSGNFHDKNTPSAYIAKGQQIYRDLISL